MTSLFAFLHLIAAFSMVAALTVELVHAGDFSVDRAREILARLRAP